MSSFGGGVQEDVHVALAGLDHGNRGVGHDGLDQLPAAAGNQDVDPAAGAHQGVGAVAAVLVDALHGVGGKAHRIEGVAEHGDEGGVGGGSGGPAAQDDGVAALQGQPGDVHGDVGAGLVDGGDNAHGHVDLAQPQAVGQGLAAHHVADRIRQVGEVLQGSGEAVDAGVREGQAVQHCRGRAVGFAGGDVLGVGGEDPGLAFQQRGGDGAQPAVLPGPVGAGHPAGGLAGAVGDGVDGCLDVACCAGVRRGFRASGPASRLASAGPSRGADLRRTAFRRARRSGGQGLSHGSSLGERAAQTSTRSST